LVTAVGVNHASPVDTGRRRRTIRDRFDGTRKMEHLVTAAATAHLHAPTESKIKQA
jgi:hypothetical protein